MGRLMKEGSVANAAPFRGLWCEPWYEGAAGQGQPIGRVCGYAKFMGWPVSSFRAATRRLSEYVCRTLKSTCRRGGRVSYRAECGLKNVNVSLDV